jgi:uncharacterized protein YndB with AHSA1/START domain
VITHPRPAAATLTMPSDTELVITRDFNAPRELVFDAFTRPEHVKRWWGMCGSSVPTCEIDLRVGGRWRWVLSAPGGEHVFSGTYLEIVRPGRLVYTEWYEAIPGAEYVATADFAEHDGKTTLRVRLKYKSVEHRDGHLKSGMESGMHETHRRLDELLAELTGAKAGAPAPASH